MATNRVSFVLVVIIMVAVLVVLSGSAAATGLPCGRNQLGTSSSDQFSQLSIPSDSKNHDAFVVSFSNWTFQIDYVKSGFEPSSPFDMNEIAKGIYVAGPMNWRMSFSILEVFEFKNNGSSSFGPEDTVISSVDIARENYTMLPSLTENTPNWGVRHTHTAISQDGLITLVFVTNSEYVYYDLGGDIDPTEIHLNIRISRYNFSEESNATGLKILVRSQSSEGISYQESNYGALLNITTAQPFAGGTIAWQSPGYVNGDSNGPSGFGSGWEDGNLTLAYPRTNTLMQDIVFKVRSNLTYYTNPDSLSPNPVVYAAGIGAAVATITVAVVLAKRGRQSRNH
jgi:hypothetical protein